MITAPTSPPSPRSAQRATEGGSAWVWPGQVAVLAALLAVALLARLYEVGRRSLWLDELISVGIAALPLRDFLQALTVEANMTLYYWALFVWVRLVGLSADETTIRLLSVLAGAAAAPLTYLLGRRLHSNVAGLLAGLLLALHAYHASLSQEARAYGLLSSLTVLSYLLLDQALQSGRRRDWLLHGVITAAAFYSHFFTAFTVLAQGLFVLSQRSRTALLGFVTSGLVMGMLLAQLAPFFIHHPHGATLYHLQRPSWHDVAEFLLNYGGVSGPLLLLYALLGIVGLARGGDGGRPPAYRAWMLLSWLLLPSGLVLGVSLVRPIFADRYLFAVLPVLPLLAGIGIARLPRPACLSFAIVMLALSAWTLKTYLPERWEQEWRGAVAHATARAQPGDGWIFISKWGQNAFEYYAGWHWGRDPSAPYGDVLEPLDWYEAARVPKYIGVLSMDALARFAATHRRIWLVQSNDRDLEEGLQASRPVRQWLSDNGFQGNTQGDFNGIRLILYQRRAS